MKCALFRNTQHGQQEHIQRYVGLGEHHELVRGLYAADIREVIRQLWWGAQLTLFSYRLKSGEGLSLFFVIVWLLGDITNLFGGIMVHLLIPMLILALYYTTCDIILLYQMYIYRGSAKSASIDALERVERVEEASSETQHLLSQKPTTELEADNKRQTLVTLGCTALIVLGAIIAFTLNFSKDYTGTPVLHSSTKAQVVGWTSAMLYITSRVPQIIKNRKTKCEGLSIPLFCFALCGNISYVAQVMFESTEKDYLLVNLSWLVGTIGTVLLDFIVLCQYFYYKSDRIRVEEQLQQQE